MEEKIVWVIEKMFVLPDAGSLCAFFDVTVNGALRIRGCRIVKGKKGLFITLPREQGKDAKWYDTVVCLNAATFEDLSKMALAHYEEVVK